MAIYLDNAATTPIAPEVVETMIPILRDGFGNPSSTHSFGRKAKALIETSRRSIAKHINCKPSEIIFTSGGTEADNMAINSAVHKMNVTHIITSKIEHHAVGHTAMNLKNVEGIISGKSFYSGNIDLTEAQNILDSYD